MKIITLVENTTISNQYKAKPGLSLYIETNKHKILFDLGSNGLFLENAKKLGVNISDIDTVIISHGHVDHGGALEIFLRNNSKANVYVQATAFDRHFTKVIGFPVDIGLKDISEKNRIIYIDKGLAIDNELFLFSDVKGDELTASSNKALFKQVDKKLQTDDFCHEQTLIITEEGKSVLVAGCAHRGIINIQKRAEELIKKELDYVISGFHLYNPISKKCEKDSLIKDIAERIQQSNTQYYTCHCTGRRAFKILKSIMDDKIQYLATGSSICI